MKRKELTGIIGCFALLLFATVAWDAPIPDTGQTKCYDVAGNVITCPSPGQPLYGQDANYSINPMSYTKLDGSGNALSDSAASWAMVRDNVTGLVWEMKTNADGGKNYNDPHDADNTYTWYDPTDPYPGTPESGTDTEDFIKALNDAHYGSYSDWRLPTITELRSIVNKGIPYPGPSINTSYFPNSISGVYYSSTTTTFSTSNAWGVVFCHGGDTFWPKNDDCFVRAVRGGQSRSAYVNNGNGTVTDTSTGLMWQQNTLKTTMIWENALSYCENLQLAGYTDWRLPTIKELLSLVDYSRDHPAINTTYFPITYDETFWSSSSETDGSDLAFVGGFRLGSHGGGYKVCGSFNGNIYCGGYYVRAVRGGQSGSFDIGLTGPGWNLISLPQQPSNTAISSVLGALSGKYSSAWAFQNGSWKVFDPAYPGFSDLTTLETGWGYWLNMTEPATFSVTGTEPSKTMNLIAGWNLVGFNSSTSLNITSALPSIAGKVISVWAYKNDAWQFYDPASPGFSDLTTMAPGYGYWINTNGACSWTLP